MWAMRREKKNWMEPQINTYFYKIYVKEKMRRVCANPVSNRFMPSSKAIFMHACTLCCDEGRRGACLETQKRKRKKKKNVYVILHFSHILWVCSCCAFFFSCDFGRLSHTQNDTHTYTNYESSSFGVCVCMCACGSLSANCYPYHDIFTWLYSVARTSILSISFYHSWNLQFDIVSFLCVKRASNLFAKNAHNT